MKHLTAILVAALLCACGGTDDPEQRDTRPEAPKREVAL